MITKVQIVRHIWDVIGTSFHRVIYSIGYVADNGLCIYVHNYIWVHDLTDTGQRVERAQPSAFPWLTPSYVSDQSNAWSRMSHHDVI